MKQETILLLEDDPGIMRANLDMLEMDGFRVLVCTSLKEARQAVWEETPDLMVLDVRLPDGSGWDFCREYRAQYGNATPVLFLTVMKGSEDMVEGYEAGATDYLVKPFGVKMLRLKVQALLAGRAAGDSIVVGPLRLDSLTGIACLDETDLLLTPKEFAVLVFLARNRHRYLTVREVYEAVWGAPAAAGERTVKEHIREIRKKMDSHAGVEIVSEQGKGYRLIRSEQ